MNKLLSSIDQFGIQDKLQIHPHMPVQRSVIGGIVTIILYGLSLSYFLSQFVEWVNNNKLPKITSYQRQIQVEEVVELKGRFLEISSYQWQEGTIDPFDPENLIFYPMVKRIPGDWTKLELIPTQFEIVSLPNGKKSNFYLEDKEVKGSPPNSGQNKGFSDYMVVFHLCDQSWLQEGQKCADEKLVTLFNQQVNYVQILIYITQYDSKTKQLYKIPKSSVQILSIEQVYFYQYELEMANLQADDGILFSRLNNFSYITDFALSVSQFDQNYSIKQFGAKASLVTYFTLGQIKLEVLVEFPRISEILADTGSIITWILQISFLVSKYNEKICSDKTVKEIIKMYFPDIEELALTKNLTGQIISASMKDKQYDPKKISLLLNQMGDMAISKVSYINLQFEVSRYEIQDALGINYLKQHLISQNKLQDLLETQDYKVLNQSHSNVKSLLQILPSKQSNELNDQQQLQDSVDQDNINQFKIESMDKIDSTIGLLMRKEEELTALIENDGDQQRILQREEVKTPVNFVSTKEQEPQNLKQ